MACFKKLKVFTGLLYFILQSQAEKCNFYYTVQPGPTTETCNLAKDDTTFLELQCEVSSDGRHFTIQWHYSSSEPQASNVLSTSNFIDNSEPNIEIKSDDTQNTTVISILIITSVNFKEDGYIWCSVNDPQATATNPSSVLHIFPCSASNQQCVEEIYLKSISSRDAARCANRNVSVDVIQAQNCSISYKEETPKPGTTSMAIPPMDVDMTTSNTVLNKSTTLKNTTEIGSSSLNTYIIIGASLGAVIIVLSCIIVLLVMCRLRAKVNHQRREHSITDELSPFDDIRMHITTETLETCNTDDPNRVSKLLCESNVCYDEHPRFSLTHSTENMYDYVH